MVQALSRESAVGTKEVEKFVAGIFETHTHFSVEEFRVKVRDAHDWTGLMRTVKNWDFDVFALRKLTKSPLKVVGIAAAREIQMFDRNDLNFDEGRFEAFLVDVCGSYCKNPYHNSLHAADVVQVGAFMYLTQRPLSHPFRPLMPHTSRIPSRRASISSRRGG